MLRRLNDASSSTNVQQSQQVLVLQHTIETLNTTIKELEGRTSSVSGLEQQIVHKNGVIQQIEQRNAAIEQHNVVIGLENQGLINAIHGLEQERNSLVEDIRNL